MAGKRGTQLEELEIDMTPMIDVTFLLLVFFMIISVFNQMERAAELDLPTALQAIIEQDVAKERVIVNIEQDGSIVLFGQRVGLEGFRAQLEKVGPTLRQFGRVSGAAPVVIRGDKDCPFEHIRSVLAVIYDQQIDKFMFAAHEMKTER